MPSLDGLSDISIDGDDGDGINAAGDRDGEDAFVPAAELKRIAGSRMEQESPGDAPVMAPLPGFVWYAPYEEQSRLQEQTIMEDARQYNKPYSRPPYCFLCDTIGDDENPYRRGALDLIDEYYRMDPQTLVCYLYRYYEGHVRRLNGNREWAVHIIWAHIRRHDPKLINTLVHEERIINQMIDARVQSLYEVVEDTEEGGGNSRSTKLKRTQPCAKAENQLLKMLRMSQTIHEAKRRALKEASGTTNGSGGGGGGSGGGGGAGKV